MKRIFIRLFILLNPIHPLKLNNKQKSFLFKVFRRTKWFKWYFFKYLNHFGGYPVFITHRDGKKERAFVLYYPHFTGNMNSRFDYSKVDVEIRKENIKDYREIPIKYVSLVM